MSMLNLAGASYDFGNVVFAVLQECEHRRRGFLPNEAEAKLFEVARAKLAEVRRSYEDAGGSEGYWQALEKEVLETTMPQYVPSAAKQSQLEQKDYGLWRGGDPLARGAFALAGLSLGALIVALPLNPLLEDPLALALAAVGFLYPEIRRWGADYRHARLLNRLITEAEAYQKDQRIHYTATSELDEALRSLPGQPAEDAEAGEEEPPAGRRMGPEPLDFQGKGKGKGKAGQ